MGHALRRPAGAAPSTALQKIRRVAAGAAVLIMVATITTGTATRSARADNHALTPLGDFRPFPDHNPLQAGGMANVVDSARRRWFMFTATEPDHPNGQAWLFDVDRMAMIGQPVDLPG